MRGSSAAGRDERRRSTSAQETQNLRVRVVPSLGDSASTVIALVNPLLAIPAAIAQNILKDPLGHIFAFDYSVTGGWSDPKVAKLGVEARELGPQRSEPVKTRVAAIQMVSAAERAANLAAAGRLIAAAAGGGRAPRRAAGELLPHRPARRRQGEGCASATATVRSRISSPSGAAARVWLVGGTVPIATGDESRDPQRLPALRRRRASAWRATTRCTCSASTAPATSTTTKRARSSPAAGALAVREPLRAPGAVGLLRCALSRALPRARRLRRHVRSLRLHRAHRPRALGDPAARARHREPGLRVAPAQGGAARERPAHLRPHMIVDPWGEVLAVRPEGEGAGARARSTAPGCARCVPRCLRSSTGE